MLKPVLPRNRPQRTSVMAASVLVTRTSLRNGVVVCRSGLQTPGKVGVLTYIFMHYNSASRPTVYYVSTGAFGLAT